MPSDSLPEQSVLSDLEEAVIRAIRDGKEPNQIRGEVERAITLGWNVKCAMEDPAWGVGARSDA